MALGLEGGEQLDRGLRPDFQGHVGLDFSRVSVHAGSTAGMAAQAIGAGAFMVGRQIFFTTGRDGTPLWARRPARSTVQAKMTVGGLNDPAEREADQVADEVAGGTGEDTVTFGEQPAAPASDEPPNPTEADTVRRAVATARVAPGWEQSVSEVRQGGRPLPASDRSFMEGRFGADFGQVRIHDDERAQMATAAIGAQAFAVGNDIVFGAGRYAAGTPRGRNLLAHELAHVLQQRGGAGPAGTVRRKPAASPAFHFTVTPPAPMDAMAWRVFVCTQVLGVDATKAAEYAVRYTWTGQHNTGGVTQADVGKRIGVNIEAALYRSLRVGAGTGDAGAASTPEGGARSAEFNALAPDMKDALNREADRRFWRRTGTRAGTKLGKSATDKDNAKLWLDIRDEVLQQRQALAGLPGDVQKALGGVASFKPGDYVQLSRIANKLTAEEWSDYISRVTAQTQDLEGLEASVDAYVERRRQSEAQVAAFRAQQLKLAGTEDLYTRYKDYLQKKRVATEGTIIAGPAGGMHLPPGPPQIEAANQAERDLTTSLVAAGFKGGIPDFEASITAFVTNFEQQTVAIGLTTLDRYEGFLYRQSQYYEDDGVISQLYDSLAPFRADYARFAARNKLAVVSAQQYESQEEQSRTPGSGHIHPDPALKEQAEAAHLQAVGARQQAIADVQAIVPQHPIFSEQHLPLNRRIPKEALAQADKAGVKRILAQHIADRTSDVREAKADLRKDPESIYKMGQLLAEARRQLDITPGSIFDTLINEKIEKIHRDETIIAVVVGVLALAFMIMTLGTGAVAVAGAVGALGLGGLSVYQEYERYRVASAAAGSGLSSEEPSPAWLVISVVGALGDVAAAAQAVRALSTAARALEAGGELTAFRSAVRDLEVQGQIDAKIARSVEAAGEAQKAYTAAKQEFSSVIRSRTYSFPGPLADLDVHAAVVKMAAARFRQGIESVNQFILELNQMRIEAKLAKLSDEELALAKQAYQEGVESAKVGTYSTKIQWGIQSVEARPYGPGFLGKRTVQANARVNAYELKINPNGESFYLPHPQGGYVQFENIVGSTVQDGKLVLSPRSIYHVADMPSFASEKVLAEARRQLEAAQRAGLTVEWLVSDPKALTQLQDLFKAQSISIKLTPLPE